MPFIKATKHQSRLRIALIGPAGGGKTYTALKVAQAIVNRVGGRIALIDTEHGSASKYADTHDFDTLELDSFHPENYIAGIKDAEEAGYTVLVIDSLSHAWMGKDGTLQLVDQAAKKSRSGNSFNAWGDVTPLQNKLIDTMLGSKLHLIATMRSKMEYVQEKDKDGKTVIRKVGLQPIQRDNVEFEFDVVADLDMDNNLMVGKTRCSAIAGKVFPKAGKDVADILLDWVSDGSPAPEKVAEPAPAPATNGHKKITAAQKKQIGQCMKTLTEAKVYSDMEPFKQQMQAICGKPERDALTADQAGNYIDILADAVHEASQCVETGLTDGDAVRIHEGIQRSIADIFGEPAADAATV